MEVIHTERYKYLSQLDCFPLLLEKCSEDYLDELEKEMQWYETEANNNDIGDGGENLSEFLLYVYGGGNDWLEELEAI